MDVRWVAVTSTSGTGLLATAEFESHKSGTAELAQNGLSVSASRYSKQQLEDADYDFQIAAERRTYLNLDGAQMGVGGNDSWGAFPLDEYLLPNQDYHYRFTICGIDEPPAIPGTK